MKLAKFAALMLCIALFAGMLTACGEKEENNNGSGNDNPGNNISAGDFSLPAGFSGIDFSNGNIDFLMLHYKPFDSSPNAKLELGQWGGANAAKITPDGAAVPYIAIDACSLLGDRVTDVRAVEVIMAVENPDGTFHAVAGEIIAYSGADRTESKASWSVFLERTNPNTARMELKNDNQHLVSGAYNMFIVKRADDSALIYNAQKEHVRGTASNLYILGIGFLDVGGNYLPVNADAKFNEPPRFNESSIRHIELGEMNCINSANQSGWLTDETDGIASPYLIEDMSAAQQLVLEFATPPRGELQLIWLGSGNDWSWQQETVFPDGGINETSVTLNLHAIFGDFDKAKHENYDGDGIPQMKLILGYFNYSVPCDNCDDGSCDLCNRNGRVVTPQTVEDLQITRAYLVINE